MPPDPDLLDRWIAAADQDAFAALVERHAGLVHRACQRQLGAADADDAAQAVFLVLAGKARDARAQSSLPAWLLAVARRVCANARRVRHRRQLHEAEAAMSAPMISVPPPAAGDPLLDRLDAAIAELPAEERVVIAEHMAGTAPGELAARLGCPAGTIRSRLSRALDRLRRRLAPERAATSAALAALIASEAAAADPGAAARILAPTPTGHGAAAAPPPPSAHGPIPAPSATAMRWSQDIIAAMTPAAPAHPRTARLGLAAAGLLALAGGIAVAWPGGGIPAATPATHGDGGDRPAGDQPTAPAPAQPDPARMQQALLVRIPDLPRTAARLRAAPEAALLPPAAWTIIDAAAGRFLSATAAIDPGSAIAAARRRDDWERHLRRMRGEPAGPEQAGAERAASSATPHCDATAILRTADADALKPLLERPAGAGGPISIGLRIGETWWEALSAQRVDAADGALHGDGWRLAPLPAGAAGLRFASAAAEPGLGLGWLETELADARSEDDLVIANLLRHHAAAPTTLTQATMRLRIAPEGMRLSLRSAGGEAEAAFAGGRPGARSADRPRQRIAGDAFAAIPADAVAAAALALAPGEASSSPLLGMAADLLAAAERSHGDGGDRANLSISIGIGGGVDVASTAGPAGRESLAGRMLAALDAIDGELRAWVQPAAPLPALTLVADLPAAAADELMRGCGIDWGGQRSAEHRAGPIRFACAHADGRLWITTHPGGIAACRGGGFDRTAEAAAALADMPAEPGRLAIVLRPAALADLAAPYLALAGDATAMQRVLAWQERLHRETTRGWLHLADGADGLRLDAAGLIAGAAAAAAAAIIADGGPGLLDGIN